MNSVLNVCVDNLHATLKKYQIIGSIATLNYSPSIIVQCHVHVFLCISFLGIVLDLIYLLWHLGLFLVLFGLKCFLK